MKMIDMKNWTSLFPNADQEDLVSGEMMLCKNFEPKNGMLVKTHGPGLKLDGVRNEGGGGYQSGFGTFIHPELTNDYLIFANVVIANNIATISAWDSVGEEWVTFDTYVPNYVSNAPDRGSYWYQKHQRGNPVILHGDELRVMCGHLSEVSGEPALPLWCGYIAREFFSESTGGYEPGDALYAYTAPLVAPDIDVTMLETHGNGGPYNAEIDRHTIEALSTAKDTITLAGEHPEIVPGNVVRIRNNTANNGLYYIVIVGFEGGNTVMKFDSSYKDLVNKDDLDGYVLPYAPGETKWYKFSYIYDGVQESLLTEDPIAFKMRTFDNVVPRFEWTIADKTAHNFRITALVVYRSDTRDGIYNRIQIVDYIRPSTGILGAPNNGAYTGHSVAYVPGLSDFAFIDSTAYTLLLKTPEGGWQPLNFTWNTGDSAVVFAEGSPTGLECAEKDFWDCAWILKQGATTKITGATGAYAGEQTIIIPNLHATGGEGDAAGGVFYFRNASESQVAGHKGVISAAATSKGGDRTEFTTSKAHGLMMGCMVDIYGYDDDKGYNGAYTIISIPTTTTFVVEAAFTTDTAGNWACHGRERTIDDNYGAAFHVSSAYKVSVYSSEGWDLMRPQHGLFYATDMTGDVIRIRFYDNGITAGIPHYLDGEKAIHINGDCAVVVQDILFQGNLVLDPGGENEVRSNYISDSKLGMLDVTPMSNIKRNSDREGGDILAQVELMGNVVTVSKFGMTTTHIVDPGDRTTWKHRRSPHNIGTIARLGCISAHGSIWTTMTDGFYRLRPNNLAPSDETPSEVMKISEEIENIFKAMTFAQKQAVVTSYDPLTSEILFAFSYDQDESSFDSVYAYDIVKNTWREIHTSVVPGAFWLDQEGNLLVWDSSGLKIHSFVEDAADPRGTVRFPYSLISDVREEVVRDIKITYMSASDLQVNLYAEHSSGDIASGSIEEGINYVNSGYTNVRYNDIDYINGASFTGVNGVTIYTTTGSGGKVISVVDEAVDSFTLPASARPVTYHHTPRTRCMKFALEITEDFGSYLKVAQTSFGTSYLVVARHGGNYPNTEIHRIRIWHD